MSSGSGFFKLNDSGDSAIIRLPYHDLEELFSESFYEVHEINSQSKDYRAIDCLRGDEDPIEDCPFCENGMKTVPKMFVQVYDVESEEMKIWSTTKARIKDFTATLDKEDLNGKPLFAFEIKIVRDGTGNGTRYNFKKREADNTRLEDLPDFVDIYESKALLKLDADEMEDYIRNKKLPGKEEKSSSRDSIKRRGTRDNTTKRSRRNSDEF
jgi:hypothetical protein